MPRFTTLIRSKTLRVAGAVAAIAVTAPLTHSASAVDRIEQIRCPGRSKVVPGQGIWQQFTAPQFQPGVGVAGVAQDITAYAVSPVNSKVVAITNGNSVYVSRTGGCTWSMSFRLDEVPSNPTQMPLSGRFATIKSLYIAPTTGTFYALAEEFDNGAGVTRPHVLRSGSGTFGSWALGDSGLPPVGKPLLMRGNPKNGRVLYLSFAGARDEATTPTCPPAPLPCDNPQQGRQLGLLYRSTDGGATWQSRTSPSDLNGVAAIKHFSVDDDDASGNMVWVVANGLLRLSKDGGQSYVVPDGVDQVNFTFSTIESLSNSTKSAQVKLVAFSTDSQMLRLHKGQWKRSNLPFNAVASVAQRPEGDIMVATSPSQGGLVQNWRIPPGRFLDYDLDRGAGRSLKTTFGWVGVTPGDPVKQATTIQAGAGAPAGTFYLSDKRRVLRFLSTRLPDGEVDVPTFDVGAPPPPRGLIAPSTVEIDLLDDKPRVVDYKLTLGPAPTPIDVFLMVDNSGSMQAIIDDLKLNLGKVAQSLVDSGVDVQMGVGQINTQPERATLPIDDEDTPEDESQPKPIYQTLRKIGPVDANLGRALGKLDGNGGSGSEPQVEALYQAALTDEGLSYVGNVGWLTGYSIKPGQNAQFRDKLNPFKIIVLATDEEFSTDIRGQGAHNEAQLPEVARGLKDAGIKVIGLSQGIEDAAKDLRKAAELTGALAPPSGTDCDGDGRIGFEDVKGGKPLVCGQSYGLDSTLVNLIRAIRDPQTISLQTNNAPTMLKVSKAEFHIDAKQSTSVRFKVTYSCKGLADGLYPNDITASLRGKRVGATSANINCGGVKNPPPPAQPAPLVEPVGNPPPPQPQPVAPAPLPVNPVPQVQTQPQVQSQVNPQAGMADQEEQQFQLAAAENDLREEDQLAMTGISYEDSPAVVLGLGVAMAALAGAGVAIQRRSRTASARVTVRR